MKRLTGGQIGCLILMTLFIVLYMLFAYYERHKLAGLYHYIIGTKNIKEPLVNEEFHFDREGYERIYKIKPKYRGYYYVYIQFENYALSWDDVTNVCKGSISIIYKSKGKTKKETTKNSFIGYLGSSLKNGDCCGSIFLDDFPYYNSIFREDIDSIIVRVNKPMTCFPKGGDKKTYLIIRYTYNL